MKERLQNKKLEDLKLEKVSGGAVDKDMNSSYVCTRCKKYTGTMSEVMNHMKTCMVDQGSNQNTPDPNNQNPNCQKMKSPTHLLFHSGSFSIIPVFLLPLIQL